MSVYYYYYIIIFRAIEVITKVKTNTGVAYLEMAVKRHMCACASVRLYFCRQFSAKLSRDKSFYDQNSIPITQAGAYIGLVCIENLSH